MKTTLTFIFLVFLSVGLCAQVDLQQDLISLKKQVNSIRFDNNKLKKQFNESIVIQNSRIGSLEKILQTTDSSVKSHANTLVKNSTVVSEMKEETNAKIKSVRIFTWVCLILILLTFGYIIFIKMKWNKANKELHAKINEIMQSIDNFIVQTNNVIEIKIGETKKILNDQLVSAQTAMENSINSNNITTNQSLQSLNNFMQETQKSNVEQIDNIKTAIENQKNILESQVAALESQKKISDNFKTVLEKQKSALTVYETEFENHKATIENTLKAETTKIITDANKSISSLKEEIERLKIAQNKSIKPPRTRKNNKKV